MIIVRFFIICFINGWKYEKVATNWDRVTNWCVYLKVNNSICFKGLNRLSETFRYGNTMIVVSHRRARGTNQSKHCSYREDKHTSSLPLFRSSSSKFNLALRIASPACGSRFLRVFYQPIPTLAASVFNSALYTREHINYVIKLNYIYRSSVTIRFLSSIPS